MHKCFVFRYWPARFFFNRFDYNFFLCKGWHESSTKVQVKHPLASPEKAEYTSVYSYFRFTIVLCIPVQWAVYCYWEWRILKKCFCNVLHKVSFVVMKVMKKFNLVNFANRNQETKHKLQVKILVNVNRKSVQHHHTCLSQICSYFGFTFVQ